MFNRFRGMLSDFFQQADLVLLGLCCGATLFGMVLIASATRYMGVSSMIRYVGVQGAAMLIGLAAYVLLSMVDVELLHHLLQAIPRGKRLILVGDPDQLPPVGPGFPFGDMLRSGSLPTVRLTGAELQQLQYLFSIDGRAYYLCTESRPMPGADWQYFSTGALRRCIADDTLFACAAAGSLYRWYRNTRFCGCCGARLRKSETERAMVCPECGNVIYPKICPAVIVAVHDGDRLVLTRYKDRPIKHLALVAGFNEIGETIEETVHREVLEETGLRVKNLRFYKSQPWVFTDTLLFGFFAELDGSDRITVQEDELAEANWYPRSEVPADTAHMSLTAEMIEQFRLGHV